MCYTRILRCGFRERSEIRLDEDKVLEIARKWVDSHFDNPTVTRCGIRVKGGDIQLHLPSGEEVWIECKGTGGRGAEVDHAIGQCVGYCLTKSIDLLYLIVPHDYQGHPPSRKTLPYLKQVISGLHNHTLPIELLIVDENENVCVIRNQ